MTQSNSPQASGWPQRWQRFSAAAVRAFHVYGTWLASISWKRFILLAVLLLIVVNLLQKLPPFTWTITESITPSVSQVKLPVVPPVPPVTVPDIHIEVPGAAASSASAAGKGFELSIDGHGVRIQKKDGTQVVTSAASAGSAPEGAQVVIQAGDKRVEVKLPPGAQPDEVRDAIEEARQQVAEDRPEIELPILQRSAGENDAVPGADGEAGLRHLGVGVLDELALVEHRVAELVRGQQLAVLAQLGVAGEPEDVVRAAGEVVAGLEHVDRELRKIFLDLLAPDRDDARGADNERGSVGDRARREEREHLERLAETHLVGEEAMAADLDKMMHPFDAAVLVGTEQLGQSGRGFRRCEDLPAPRLDLGREGELQFRVGEEREDKVRRQRPLAVGLGDVLLPGMEGLPARGLEGDDAEVGQDDRTSVFTEERVDLAIGEHSLAGAEDPAEIQAVGRGRS